MGPTELRDLFSNSAQNYKLNINLKTYLNLKYHEIFLVLLNLNQLLTYNRVT